MKKKLARVLVLLVIAILIAILMTLLSAVPPLSLLYNWVQRNHLQIVWYGLVAGVIGVCGALYLRHSKRK